MAKTITDEKLLELLLVHGGVKGAASATKLTERAIRARLMNEEFRKKYDAMRELSLENATMAMSDTLSDAVGVLRSMVNNAALSPSIRLQSADSLLKHALRYTEFVALSRRVSELESKLLETEEE